MRAAAPSDSACEGRRSPCGTLPVVHMRRPTAVLALALTAGVALAGCRTSPNVAAYVGDESITVDELQDAVAERRADPQLTPGDEPGYSRAILSQLVRAEVFDSAAEHFGVSPDPGGLPELLEQLLGGTEPEAYYQQVAAQGFSRGDALERVRQVALLRDIAVAEGAVGAPTDASLRAAYEQAVAQQPAQPSLGYINVADQATADSLVAALEADPGSYAEVAAPYLALATLPAPRPVAQLADQLPPDVAARVAETPPGRAFSAPVENVSGLLVFLVGEAPVPSFEETRPQLEAQFLDQAATEGAEILSGYEDDLEIDVNPRYGTLEEGSVVQADGGVVRLLGTQD